MILEMPQPNALSPIAPPIAPLSLDDYATASAHLTHAAGHPPDEVLARLGIPAEAWRASVAAWERAIDEESARGEHALLTAFASRFAEARAGLGDALGAPAPPAIASPPLVPAAPKITSPPPPPVGLTPATPLVSPPPPPPPPVASPPPAVPDPAWIPEVPRLPIRPQTAAVDGRHLVRPVLPFAGGPPPIDLSPDLPRPPSSDPWSQRAPGHASPPGSLRIEPTTARLDARWLPLPPEPPPAPPPPAPPPPGPALLAPAPLAPPAPLAVLAEEDSSVEPAALPLVRLKHTSPEPGLRSWLGRLWRWLLGRAT